MGREGDTRRDSLRGTIPVRATIRDTIRVTALKPETSIFNPVKPLLNATHIPLSRKILL